MIFMLTIVVATKFLLPKLVVAEDFHIHLLHYNDFHAHYMPSDFEGKECTEEDEKRELCFGGFARLKTMVDDLQQRHDNTILLNVGDYTQGNLWHTVYGWEATAHFMNKIKHTAMGIGVHELDYGPDVFSPYLEHIHFPFVCCNIDSSNVTSMKDKYNSSIVIELSGEKVGIIGYITTQATYTASPGLLEIGDEIECIEAEAKRLKSELGVKVIIAFGSAGYEFDQKIARLIDVDVVVGGKSHTFLYTGTHPATEIPAGLYPTPVIKKDLTYGLVTQAYCNGKYLGFLRVDFDSNGVVKHWSGNPILLDSTIIQDPKIAEELAEWNQNLTAIMNIEIGSSHVYLDGRIEVCRMKECNIGNILTDAMVFESLKYSNDFEWTYASVGIVNSGGIRESFDPRIFNGTIRMSNVYGMLPYKNLLAFVEIKGEYLKAAFEYSVAHLTPLGLILSTSGRFLQVSGMKVTVDICRPVGSRVVRMLVLCSACLFPTYTSLQVDQYYRIIMTEFIARGGDGYTMIEENIISFQSTGLVDSDVFVQYIKTRGTLITGIEQRIVILGQNGCKENSSPTLTASLSAGVLMLAIHCYLQIQIPT